jgi:type IV pilus biogenesis protein CpaD/CtpE
MRVSLAVKLALLALAATLLAGGHAIAHHSFAAEFDSQKPVTLTGTVVKWEMINPHGWITMTVPGPDGRTTEWMVETSNPNGLMRLGWSKRSLKAGDAITVEAFRAKDGSNTANAARITLPDGRKVFAGSAGTPAGTP